VAKRNKIWVEVVANDIHIPNHNKKAVSCLLKAIAQIRPNGVTLNGDIGDWGTFSRHTRFSPPKCHWTDSQFYDASAREYDQLNEFLDRVQLAAPRARKRMEFGNHELWVEDFIRESPRTRRDLFGLEKRLALTTRGYDLYKYNDFMKLGKLRVTHGMYTGAAHAKKHVEAMGTSILYGHLHDIQVHSKVTPENISHMGWCNGCLCNMNPDYLRNRPQNWNHGFAIVYVWPNGAFQCDVIRINDGKCIVAGQEIIG
jgi:hypothetical protein